MMCRPRCFCPECQPTKYKGMTHQNTLKPYNQKCHLAFLYWLQPSSVK